MLIISMLIISIISVPKIFHQPIFKMTQLREKLIFLLDLFLRNQCHEQENPFLASISCGERANTRPSPGHHFFPTLVQFRSQATQIREGAHVPVLDCSKWIHAKRDAGFGSARREIFVSEICKNRSNIYFGASQDFLAEL